MDIYPRTELLDSLWKAQDKDRYVSDETLSDLAKAFGISVVEVEGVTSFYHFFHRKHAGKYTIYLNDSILSELSGYEHVRKAFEVQTGARMGGADPTQTFGLFSASCIGLSDQEPAALINWVPFTNLTVAKVKELVAALKNGTTPEELGGIPDTELYNLCSRGPGIFFRKYEPGVSLRKISTMTPDEVIQSVSRSKLQGMGGAFFPTGLKWEFCKKEPAAQKYIICNADEGEPGTFKDRVLLQHYPGLVLEGMILAGYAVGAQQGIIYLRAEYRYLMEKLQQTIDEFYEKDFLGYNITGKSGFHFDIRIQLGAGAYVCGAETALLESLEGKRGEPRIRQYFPTQKGFLDKPTVVNNVETLAGAARIIEWGDEAFLAHGTEATPGTKLLSVGGDCGKPGVYEIDWGLKLGELLEACEAKDPNYIQISGAAGPCVRADDVNRIFAKEDINCNGSVMIFDKRRDILQILRNFSAFFVRESCGVCTPCRAGNSIIARRLSRLQGQAIESGDLRRVLLEWSNIIQKSSRCGLGKTSTQALTSALEEFWEYFLDLKKDQLMSQRFDLEAATKTYDEFVKPFSNEQ